MSSKSKRCTRCEGLKSVVDFGPSTRHSDGHRAWCRACYAAYVTERRHAVRDRLDGDGPLLPPPFGALPGEGRYGINNLIAYAAEIERRLAIMREWFASDAAEAERRKAEGGAPQETVVPVEEELDTVPQGSDIADLTEEEGADL